MSAPHFGWADLHAGNRFLAPVSEDSLLRAGREAGLREGLTLLELGCGNAAASLFLAQEFHLYVRGIDARLEMIEIAREAAERSPAAGRARLFHEDATHPEPGHGPVDALLSLSGTPLPDLPLVKRGGARIVGRYRFRSREVPPEVARSFPLADASGSPAWRHEASPLEWERYLRAQERALRAYREGLRPGDEVSPVALLGDRRIAAFRAHGAYLVYEIAVERGE